MAAGDSARSLMGSMAACRKQSPKDMGAEESSTLFLRETCSDSCCQSTATSAQIASLILMPTSASQRGHVVAQLCTPGTTAPVKREHLPNGGNSSLIK